MQWLDYTTNTFCPYARAVTLAAHSILLACAQNLPAMSAVPSMAAAIAASLPAPQSAPTPAAPTYEAIPASMSKVIDIESDIPVTTVQLDGMVSP